MAIIQFDAPKQLRTWLEDKPHDWAKALASRAALRSLPEIVRAKDGWLQHQAGRTFRALVFSWAARESKAYEFVAAARAVFDNRVSYAAEDAAADGAADAAALVVGDAAEARTAIGSADAASFAAGRSTDSSSAWAALDLDCTWLEERDRIQITTLSQGLMREPLWLDGRTPHRNQQWADLKRLLLQIDPNYSVWIDWYERRIRGERAAFDIPGDKGRVEDKQILRRLAEATDEDFWGKGHEYVNATLKGWLDEARARVAQNIEPLSELEKLLAEPDALDPINPDPQDLRSPQFGSDSTGRIAIKLHAGADQLRSDAQSLSRHTRALKMAQRLGEALRNHNNAGYITEIANDYVAAMESEQDGPDPSGLVFAGDQLRGAIAKHRAAGPEDDLQPLPPSADRDASAFLSAHNMYVGSDPFLDDLDRTTRGPDAPLPTANPDEIRRIADAARHDDVLAEQTYDYIIAASEAAPLTYDQYDRHSRFAAGLAQNFARYGIEFLWAYPTEAAWTSIAAGVGASLILGPLAAAGGTVAGIALAYNLARNMAANEIVYRKLLATSPAGEDNFNRLMRFLKSLPIKSLKDD